MNNRLMLLTSGIFLTLGLSSADANVIRPLEKKYGIVAIRGACANAGGSFSGGAGGSYACTKENCDGKGGTCVVDCKSDGTCKGSTPKRMSPRSGNTPASILNNGGLRPARPGAYRQP